MDSKDIGLHCSFCGKSTKEVTYLVAGPNVYICDECVQLCNDVIVDEQKRQADPPPAIPNDPVEPSPMDEGKKPKW